MRRQLVGTPEPEPGSWDAARWDRSVTFLLESRLFRVVVAWAFLSSVVGHFAEGQSFVVRMAAYVPLAVVLALIAGRSAFKHGGHLTVDPVRQELRRARFSIGRPTSMALDPPIPFSAIDSATLVRRNMRMSSYIRLVVDGQTLRVRVPTAHGYALTSSFERLATSGARERPASPDANPDQPMNRSDA